MEADDRLGDGEAGGGPRVVVGVDGSVGARAALRYALATAAVRGATVEVLTACSLEPYWTGVAPLAVPDVAAVRRTARERAEAAVADARAATPEAAGTPVEVVVTLDGAAPELVRLSRGADLLVVGSRGRGEVRSALLGSVALHVTTHAGCPVVVVRAPAGPDVPAPAAGPRRVVVGLDGSPTGRAALTAAVEEAVRLAAELDVVACFSMDTYWADLWQVPVPTVGEVRDRIRREAESELSAVLAERAGGPPVRVHLEATQGAPSDVLVQRARGAALLVVGSRGRGALRAALLGSVALHCVTHAGCPVLVVRPAHDRATAGPAPAVPAGASPR
ncbi:universal stress protein [Trujillonella humicola]|uniref:universal stress protein n=1 Tax=Trujillonella humicola TaxID=3383699 RepID=UPI003905817E